MRLMLLVCGIAGIVLSGCSRGPAEDVARSALMRYDQSLSARLSPQLAALGAQDAASRVRSDAGDADVTWLAAGQVLAQNEGDVGAAAEPVSDTPADAAAGYVPWRQRRGPAYPGRLWHSFGRDARELPATVWDDTKATATNPVALIGIALAGASGIALSTGGADDSIARRTARHPHQLGKFWDNVGDVGGCPGLHFAIAGAIYFNSLARDDTKNYEISKTMINALAVNGLATLALKGICQTHSPNGDPFGWPSGHTSSSFTFATVLYEEYGPWVGVPAFVFASFVGYERIDARNHDFSDVISGALMGIAIGHAVCQNHKPRILGMEIAPYIDPERGAVGIALSREW